MPYDVSISATTAAHTPRGSCLERLSESGWARLPAGGAARRSSVASFDVPDEGDAQHDARRLAHFYRARLRPGHIQVRTGLGHRLVGIQLHPRGSSISRLVLGKLIV